MRQVSAANGSARPQTFIGRSAQHPAAMCAQLRAFVGCKCAASVPRSGAKPHDARACPRWQASAGIAYAVRLYSMDPFLLVNGWRCPLCRSTDAVPVVVSKSNRTQYKTEFFECAGCSAMFRHPGRFTRLGRAVRRWAGDIGPVGLDQVYGRLISEPRSLWVRTKRR